MKTLGVDVGSTTLKYVLLDENNNILAHDYQRHRARAMELCGQVIDELAGTYDDEPVQIAISGSAGMGMAEQLDIPFVQEVYATRIAVRTYAPGTDVVIELGGEDAKILFLSDGFEMRMNGTCAGGTGAFIDQMASLMNITPDEMNELASHHEKVYSIASRCGVFAKSDIQPLLNQGAHREDVAAGIFYAVVNQTIAGLAQGRQIQGNVMYLGGPMTFFPELRKSFDDTLKLQGHCPENSLYFVSIGAALAGVAVPVKLSDLANRIRTTTPHGTYSRCKRLFSSQEEYQKFLDDHAKASEGICTLTDPNGEMALGIDAGSTTVKLLLCDTDGNIFRPLYRPNNGNPIPLVLDYLKGLYAEYPDIKIRAAAVTGYGEDLVRNAFKADFGIVETIAHFTAAKKFRPDVDFILDIGGQDIKCFRIRNGAIDSIFLNEACSSGCGSFLQTFAASMGYEVQDFVKAGLFAEAPVDLGSRCTVFMNSSVKQAQKDGATIQDISAGLSISVVKNALYKVIRAASADSLGKHIVVQGGTLLNDAVLRAFEQEIDREVIRPKEAALMGAYGAALYALERSKSGDISTILNAADLADFFHKTVATTCNGCGNHCHLTVNTFAGGGRFIAGNRCERPTGGKIDDSMNMYRFKRDLLKKYRGNELESGKKTIAIPMVLNMYELLPFWYTFWKTLGFNVLVSPESSRELYRTGQHTIPSDTVCYPAKLAHGHMEWLMGQKPDAIFYPDMSYNVDEGKGINHYNCPVVAYYPIVLKDNVQQLKHETYICDFIGLHDRKEFIPHIFKIASKYFPEITKVQVKQAAAAAYAAYDAHMAEIHARGDELMKKAADEGMPIVILCGRPYHIDPEISHGIDRLICSLGAAVVTEDAISQHIAPFGVKVMNQWTYHARLYAAARYVAQSSPKQRIQLVQLVSFGCGVDAITTDEVRSILEDAGKFYTQIKIDEISNMGTIKIRLRSLFSAAEKEYSDS